MFIPPLPGNLKKLKEPTVATMSTINTDMVQKVWDELDYRNDVCRMTKGAHIEHS
jgi:hypothetical protein